MYVCTCVHVCACECVWVCECVCVSVFPRMVRALSILVSVVGTPSCHMSILGPDDSFISWFEKVYFHIPNIFPPSIARWIISNHQQLFDHIPPLCFEVSYLTSMLTEIIFHTYFYAHKNFWLKNSSNTDTAAYVDPVFQFSTLYSDTFISCTYL